MTTAKLPLVFPLLIAALLLTQITNAQTASGTIAGTVVDASGGVVANAEVKAKNTASGETRSMKTGPNGSYRFDNVLPSTYDLSATAPNFGRKDVTGLNVSASMVTSQNITLEVGGVQQVVEVSAGTSQIQTDSGDLSQTVSTIQIQKLPISSLNPIDLVPTQPGISTVASRDNFTNGSGFSADGLRPRANNFLIDGFDNNDYGISGQALQPQNIEAVKEVSVLRNSYAPEYGRGGSSVTNVIYKNGTNQIHGSAFERYTGSGLDALTADEQNSGITSVPRLVDNTFGFTVGGPAIKNKLFLFGDGQWDHTNGDETGNPLIIPTAQGVASLNAIAGASPNASILVNSLGGLSAPTASSSINVGNRTGCGSPCMIQVGQLIRTPTQISRSYEYMVRGDWNASPNDTLTVRFIGSHNSLTPDLFANPNALPTTDTFQGGPANNFGLYYTHIFSPTMLNELRFTYQHINFGFEPLSTTTSNPLYADPNITIAGFSGVSFGGLTSTFPQGRGHDTFQYQDSHSWTRGNHSFKAGADITHLEIHDGIPFNNRGSVSIVSGGSCSSIGLTTCTGLANFLDNLTGPSGSAGKQFGSPNVAFNWTIQGYYFQDAWKITPTLTMTYGLRYEYYGRPFNFLAYPAVNGQVLTDPINTRVPQQADTNNWGPRMGVAWNPGHGKTVFRMGSGVFYDGFFTNITDNSASTAPNVLGGTFVAPNTGRGASAPLSLVSSVTPTLNPLSTVDTISSNLVSPLTYQWNASVERQLPFQLLATAAYVGTRGNHLFINLDLNPGVNGVRLNPARGSIVTRTNGGDSEYHGLQLDLRRNFTHGLFVELAYTYSKAIDTGSEVFTSSGGSSYPQNMFNVNGERGPSAFDRPQRLAFTWLYSLPYRGHGVAAYLIRNWTLSGTAQLQSGAPDTIFIPQDLNGDLHAGNDRPIAGNPSAPINYSDACVNSTSCITGVGTIAKNGSLIDFNTGAPGSLSQFRYIVPASGLGNLGRNTFRNGWTQNYTVALERIIPIPRLEGHQIELRLESTNPFNHPNPGIVSPNIDDPTFMNAPLVKTGGRSVFLWGKYRF
jgi:outer membrane receptor protein involved in Fe transport